VCKEFSFVRYGSSRAEKWTSVCPWFEVWLEHGSERKAPPEQLPIVLQAGAYTRPLLSST